MTANYDTIRRAFAVYDGLDGPDGLWWRTDAEYAPVTLFSNCNDLFEWGCADCEEISDASIGELEQARDHLRILGPRCEGFADCLFAARRRGMRPQGPYYRYIPEEAWPLFDACGPERLAPVGTKP